MVLSPVLGITDCVTKPSILGDDMKFLMADCVLPDQDPDFSREPAQEVRLKLRCIQRLARKLRRQCE